MVYILQTSNKTIICDNYIVAPGSCKNEDWRDSFNNTGWSKCPSTFPYINGLYRNKSSDKKQDKINRLEKANCCEGFENIKSECVEENWWKSFDK